ncbi:unnamed protein product [Soboliphyme baturini]|uniref:Uncharacterized protein n=1 Tax=Soboliphyme baturini TaxID=241478 RepID=A0A183IAH2_9BILA|nr:unnamed protein product [Soboliphyme baturini]
MTDRLVQLSTLFRTKKWISSLKSTDSETMGSNDESVLNASSVNYDSQRMRTSNGGEWGSCIGETLSPISDLTFHLTKQR